MNTMMTTELEPDQEKPLLPEIAMIRNQLKELGAWSERGEQFLRIVSEPNWDPPQPSEESRSRLSVVVQDALKGIDIVGQYPGFFQELMTNTILRGVFLLELEQGKHEARFASSRF